MPERADKEWIERLERLAASSLPDLSVEDLYQKQRESVDFIVRNVQRQAISSFDRRNRSALTSGIPTETRREIEKNPRWRMRLSPVEKPHNVYVIDGGRGSGKTSTLLTIQRLLKMLRLSAWNGPEQLDEIPFLRGTNLDTALTYRVLTTNDLMEHERPMEALLAEIDDDLMFRRACETDTERKRNFEELTNELRYQVQVGWTYAHREGQKALRNDALDFKDFARQRADLSVSAYQRIDAWHGFVQRLLASLGAELLVVVFDDCDLHPDMSEHVLNDVRHYLAHPQIATILACDVGYLNRLMVRRLTKEQMPSALFSRTSEIDGEVSRYLGTEAAFAEAQRLSHALLEKTLPPNKRTSLTVSRRSDFETLTGTRPLTQIMVGQHMHLAQLADTAVALEDKSDLQRCALEWWFLTSSHSPLITQTVRRLIQFLNRAFPPNATFPNHLPRTELADILRTQIIGASPTIRDADTISELLLSNKVRTTWLMEATGAASTASEETPDRQEWEHLTDFWLDVRIACRVSEVDTLLEPLHWLPIPHGDLPPIPPEVRHEPERRFGIAAYERLAFLPRSCLYVSQLRYLDRLIPEIVAGRRYVYRGALPIRQDAAINVTRLTNSIEEDTLASPTRQVVAATAKRDEPTLWPDVEAYFANYFHLFRATGYSNVDKLLVALDDYKIKGVDQPKSVNGALSELKTEGGVGPQFLQFCQGLSELADDLEDQRQFYVATWIMSAHLAVLGNDFSETQYRESMKSVSTNFSPPKDHPAANQRLERLAAIADKNVREDGGRSLRTRILHAWSLVPIARHLVWAGDGNVETEGHLKAFEKVARVFEIASKALQSHLKAPVERPFHGALEKLRSANSGLKTPEVVLTTPNEVLRWNFPDLDRDALQHIQDNLSDAALNLKTEIGAIRHAVESEPDKALVTKFRQTFGVGEPAAVKLLRVAREPLQASPQSAARRKPAKPR